MSPIKIGVEVRHDQFGPGRVLDIFGSTAVVEFFGERHDVAVEDISVIPDKIQPVETRHTLARHSFRQAFEAINLGVVPPHAAQLAGLSIGGSRIAAQVQDWLRQAPTRGLCKAIFGGYGTGKSHFLKMAQATALLNGWVVSLVEFDPRQTDPAKPYLVYRAVIASLRFPPRRDGTQSETFYDLIKEARRSWDVVRQEPYLKASPWYARALHSVRLLADGDPRAYLEMCDWLGGQPVLHGAISKICRQAGDRTIVPPRMPRTNETSEIYGFHLVVLHHICRSLGYRGLLLIFDEAEHVRGYTVNRRERATNLFDILSRCAHVPLAEDPPPALNEHGYVLPEFWREGPHFALMVGLTPGNIFEDPDVPLRDACVFLHSQDDRVTLAPPDVEEFGSWCESFLSEFHRQYPEHTAMLAGAPARRRIVKALTEELQHQPPGERTIRLWVKLACLVPCLILSGRAASPAELKLLLTDICRKGTRAGSSLGDLMWRWDAVMPDAWRIFFRQRRPRPIQEAAMPLLLRGQSVLLCSPTASGKTEAVFAPLYQRHVTFRRSTVSVVYVAPTKALVNDMYERLRHYFSEGASGVVQRYTGDHHSFACAEGGFAVLCTPEALDSLQVTQPELLAGIRVVVVDELHLLHGSARGQQLRSVISRLTSRAAAAADERDNPQQVAMTATLDDQEAVARLWLGTDAKTIGVGEPRPIELEVRDGGIDRALAQGLVAQLRPEEHRKVLVFSNTRNGAHRIAATLASGVQSTWPVYLHIGILARAERERIEAAMRSGPRAICVATSTLEVGIDIGDIDLIVLAEPPTTISGFLQRIGRGNRRSGRCIVWGFTEDESDGLLYRALLQCARTGRLDEVHEYWRPSVDFQQVISLAWAGCRSGDLLTMKNFAERTGGAVNEELLGDMLSQDAVSLIQGALVPSDHWFDEGNRRRIHSVIIGGSGLPIVDLATGETVGAADQRVGWEGLVFAGDRMKEIAVSDDAGIYLRHTRSAAGKPLATLPSLRGRRRELARAIVWAIAELKGIDPAKWKRDGPLLTTWGGEPYNRLLVAVLEAGAAASRLHFTAEGVSGLSNELAVTPKTVADMANRARDFDLVPIETAVKFREPTRYTRQLSPAMQGREAREAIPWTGFLRWLTACSIEPAGL